MAITGDTPDIVAAGDRGFLQHQIVLNVADNRRAGRVKMPGQASAYYRVHRDLLGQLGQGIHMLVDE